MGLGLYHWIKRHYQKEWGIAFVAAMVFGIVTHMYKFTNTLLNHDSLYNIYSNQNVIGSGRWFLSIACGISSYFDLPWINGMLSLVYIGITAILIVDLFRIKNPIVIGISSALLSVFPAVTATFFYEFTADGYMFAMLLAAFAVKLLSVSGGGYKKRNQIIGILALCFSCAIYQAYLSFAITLSICVFLYDLLEESKSKKECIKWIGSQMMVYMAALVLYWLVWKLCLTFTGMKATNYQGINQIGISIQTIVEAIPKTIVTLGKWCLDINRITCEITLQGILNSLFLLFSFYIGAVALYKSKSMKKPYMIVMYLGCILIVPFVICLWYFTSPKVEYHLLMLQSLVILYIFVLVLAERWIASNCKNVIAGLACVLIFNFMIQANIAYWQLQRCNMISYMEAVDLRGRICQMGSEEGDELAVIGTYDVTKQKSYQLLVERMPNLGGMLDYNLFLDEVHIGMFLDNLDFHLAPVSAEKKEQILKNPLIEDMSNWPQKESLQKIDGVILLKLSDVEKNEEEE